MALSRSMKLLVAVLILVAVYLAGALPAYLENRRLTAKVSDLQTRLNQAGGQLQVAALRNQLGMILIEVEQNNFGLAKERSSHFFDGLRRIIPDQTDPQLRERLAELLARRDEITSDLTSLNSETPVKIRKLFAEFPQVAPE